MQAPIIYASFDRVPAPKGAATHIEAFARALAPARGPVDLVTIAAPADPAGGAPERARWDGVTHVPLTIHGRHLIERVMHFRGQMLAWWGQRRAPIAHVRSIYEGYPLARSKGRLCDQLVYEVNGLPSIELKYHYPAVADDHELLAKLTAQEQTVLDAADVVLTPSGVTAAYLTQRGVAPERVHVIPNGVDLDRFHYRAVTPWAGRALKLLYCGTLTSWQGLHHAIDALAWSLRDFPATLTIVGPARSRQRRHLLARVRKLGLDRAVTIRDPVPQAALAALHHQHDVVLAPLPANDRNLVQGCSPLKILEAMAAGTPLVATDLPVVRALARHRREALLVKPTGAKSLAKSLRDALAELYERPALADSLSRAARARVESEFRWDIAGAALVRAYDRLA
ncbi:MAG: hypothetical protein Tsb0020_23760 [Haliangiales bacterium]